MSMIAIFRRLSDADGARLAKRPELLLDYIGEEEPPEGFGPYAELDVDKAWHGIHFLLTGTAWGGELPWGFVLRGGEALGDDDLGYGPARLLDAAQVREVAAALETLPGAELAR